MVASFFSAITAFIAEHPHLAYAAVLLLALSESIPVVGVFIPGTAAILAVSALVPSGIVKLWPLLCAAATGAIIGDGLSFWAGHRYHREILERWPLDRHPYLITRSEAFFARHGDKSVFIARFTPGVRAFIPLIAGILQMSTRRFYAANVLSALVWAPSHILPAVFVGAAFSTFGAAAKPLAILVVLIAVAVWALARLAQLALRHGPVLVSRLSDWLGRRAAASQSRWGRRALGLLDPSRSDARRLALLAVLLIGSAWLFLGILEDIVSGDPLVRADAAIYQALQELRSAPSDTLMVAITELGDPVVVIAMAVAVLLWLVWKRAFRTALYWLGAIAGASILNTAIKVALHRPRPGEPLYTGWSAFSFPSGHSTINLVLYGFLAFLVARDLPPARRLPIVLASVFLVFLIAFSRLYLGAHWFSDVIGGLAFGTAWLAGLGFSYLRGRSETVGAKGLIVVGGAVLTLAGGININRHHAFDVERYAVVRATPTMPIELWWTTGWQQLPVFRVDLTGEIKEPLTVQWAGDLASIQAALLAKGWRVPSPWTPTNALVWLTANASASQLPVISQLDNGRLPGLTLTLPNDAAPTESRLVLRLWPVDLQLTNQETAPVWAGSVVEERLSRTLSLFTLTFTQSAMNAPRAALAREFQSGRLAQRVDIDTTPDWDGRVFITGVELP